MDHLAPARRGSVTGNLDLPPIVVITSNREKRLPEPFLRRCLYVRLKFPETAEELRDIVRKNIRIAPNELSDVVLNAAVVALANKLARIAWAVLRHGESFSIELSTTA